MNPLKLSYTLALSGFLLQFVLLGAGTFVGTEAKADSLYQISLGLFITLVKAIPWLVLIPAFIMKSKNTMAWMCYICMLYFIIWILAAFSADPYNIGTTGVLVTVVQFTAAAIYTRLSKKAAAEQA